MKKTIRGIYIWKVQSGQEEEFVRRWKYNSEIFQTYPGALGTNLHRSLSDPTIFAGYASWESLEARTQAADQMIKDHPDLDSNSTDDISEVIFCNFFEAPEEIVEPTNKK